MRAEQRGGARILAEHRTALGPYAAHERFAHADGYTARARAAALLSGLGFPPDAAGRAAASMASGPIRAAPAGIATLGACSSWRGAGVLPKPFTLGELAEAVRGALG